MENNKFKIPAEVVERIRERDRVCTYCRREMVFPFERGKYWESATIEHLNREVPFYWKENENGLHEEDIVICCGACNSSRGQKLLEDWFGSKYCIVRKITPETVSPAFSDYLERKKKEAR
jgi:hypothetical protein